ncbi:hypothetical protein [uncultured Jatrophihabitans sp.]|uniref:hypothetical protein n=1 Tax=uncultured Jatrophihabitans sp. TaxID=1610747 RepID=UPI0035CC2C6D
MARRARASRPAARFREHERDVIDAEVVDEQPAPESTGTGLAVREARQLFVAHADGDTIYLQLLRPVTGYGNTNDVLQLVQTPQVDALIAQGFAVIVSSPTFPPVALAPTSLRWQPYTHYPANWVVLNPTGQVVQATSDHVSLGTYTADAAAWSLLNDIGAGGQVTKAAITATGLAPSDIGAAQLPNGSTPGFVATVGSDGNSLVYVTPPGSPVAYDTDGVPYLTI